MSNKTLPSLWHQAYLLQKIQAIKAEIRSNKQRTKYLTIKSHHPDIYRKHKTQHHPWKQASLYISKLSVDIVRKLVKAEAPAAKRREWKERENPRHGDEQRRSTEQGGYHTKSRNIPPTLET